MERKKRLNRQMAIMVLLLFAGFLFKYYIPTIVSVIMFIVSTIYILVWTSRNE